MSSCKHKSTMVIIGLYYLTGSRHVRIYITATATENALQRYFLPVVVCWLSHNHTVSKRRIKSLDDYFCVYTPGNESIQYILMPLSKVKKLYETLFCDEQVWMAVAGTFIAMILSIWVVNKLTTNHPERSDNSLPYWSYHFLSCLTYQGTTHYNFRNASLKDLFTLQEFI